MRYHPLTILYQMYQFVKNILVFALLLFFVKAGSEFWVFEYGRYVFVFVLIWRPIHIVISWLKETYEWEDHTFYLHKGIFVRKTETIPFSNIQNITRHTTLFHKLFGMTSITFETAMDGDDDAVVFQVVTEKQAEDLRQLVEKDANLNHHIHQQEEENVSEEETNKESTHDANVQTDHQNVTEDQSVIHFRPNKKDTLKASMTSLSFLAFVPILFGVIDYLQVLFSDRFEIEGMFRLLSNGRWMTAIVIVIAVIVAVIIGMVKTVIQYGRYEIASNATHIFIRKGLLEESEFSIEKKKVQALEVKQPLLKRLFGLAEVKLVSSSNPSGTDEQTNVNALYPFLPIRQAYQMIHELLPEYQVYETMQRLPKKSLWVRLFTPSWFWIIVTIGLFIFRRPIFGIEQAWWMLSLLLFAYIYLNRCLDYIHTSCSIKDDQFQLRKGGLTTYLFITKRSKVIEIAVQQNRLQRLLDIATITTTNRSQPVHTETINDVPYGFADEFRTWYRNRYHEIQLEKMTS
ncbi:membrane-flanked domain-containing protein [Gracilibacillus halophilus YIM-C55.5]|uniref:Membrane-flanked domain-containing protein n=1 Tax=Gracilibacillus halophilus YIM-C55.5 TaxID=1308866 RepID=N4WNN8_9BACI|nr:PH domain-containing protein [Gracilibacillus halophilus]ENH96075.1 membrane-flanked domain-containing protein [Gracilibacillus halophilus YIM-C55.5]